MGRKVLNIYSQVALQWEPGQGRMDWVQVFGRTAPVHLEIGSGKGTFLVSEAQAYPERDFLGVERANKYYRLAVDRIGRRALANVRLVRADAAELLSGGVGDQTLDGIHVYFPDPWPKRRHHRRRFLGRENLGQIIRVLKPGGRLQIVTDHAEYATEIQGVLEGYSQDLVPVRFQPTAGAEAGEWVGTNFERKYLKEERVFCAIAVERKR